MTNSGDSISERIFVIDVDNDFNVDNKHLAKSSAVFSNHFANDDLAFDRLPLDLKMLANQRLAMNGFDLLAKFPDQSVPAVFFDPQYRGVLDKLGYGNEGERQSGRSSLTQMSEVIIMSFLEQIDRVLKPSGHLFFWIDKFHLVSGLSGMFSSTNLLPVDLITWDKAKMGMGYRSRRRSEYLMVYQKPPKRAKGVWVDHSIPDVWQEKVGRHHPHAKPESLQSALISAVVKEGDFVIDPASGGFSTMRSAMKAGRRFIGCDLSG